MRAEPRPRWRSQSWFWPAWLGLGSVFALVTVLVADGSVVWDLVCWGLLLAPVVVVVQAIRGGKVRR